MIIFSDYKPDFKETWNAFNREARNGHLLFDRDYMDYHSDRFADCSMIASDQDRLVALFPANRIEDTAYSHQGLTFGGLVMGERNSAVGTLEVMDALIADLRNKGVSKLIYKTIPWIYHVRPSQEDLYALFRCGAQLIRRDVSTTIDYRSPGVLSKRRERGIRKAAKNALVYRESNRIEDFWLLLTEVLRSRHDTLPTHSIEEIQTLIHRFPDEIRLFTAEKEEVVEAGIVVFETPTVAHAQYIAVSPDGRSIGALDGLFDYAIRHYSNTKHYFDFGISNEDGGRVLNEGLVKQKEEFGGSSIVHDVYELKF